MAPTPVTGACWLFDEPRSSRHRHASSGPGTGQPGMTPNDQLAYYKPELVVIPCGSRKLDHPARAADLYTGSYHRACRAAAEALRPDRLLILSARYGLLDLDDVIEPYDTPHGTKDSVTSQLLLDQATLRDIVRLDPVIALGGARHVSLIRSVWATRPHSADRYPWHGRTDGAARGAAQRNRQPAGTGPRQVTVPPCRVNRPTSGRRPARTRPDERSRHARRDGRNMALEHVGEVVVDAVVVNDGHVLLVEGQGGWGLPSGVPEDAETEQATAARAVYELTGYLVDGSSLLESEAVGRSAVVCHLLSEDPSGRRSSRQGNSAGHRSPTPSRPGCRRSYGRTWRGIRRCRRPGSPAWATGRCGAQAVAFRMRASRPRSWVRSSVSSSAVASARARPSTSSASRWQSRPLSVRRRRNARRSWGGVRAPPDRRVRGCRRCWSRSAPPHRSSRSSPAYEAAVRLARASAGRAAGRPRRHWRAAGSRRTAVAGASSRRARRPGCRCCRALPWRSPFRGEGRLYEPRPGAMSTHIVSMLSMCCRPDAVPSSSPSAAALETSGIFGVPDVSKVSNASAPASGWSSPSCASA